MAVSLALRLAMQIFRAAVISHPVACSARRVGYYALTAHAMTGDCQKYMDAGCDDYIAKPIDPKNLVGLVGAWVAAPSPA
jgi:CheY-like chemotaxis protein